MKNDTLTVVFPDKSSRTFAGRDAWTLRNLINAGGAGLTTLDHPAPRWSHYVYRLRRAGLAITTDYEPHTRDYPGTHGRYWLETSLTIVERETA